MILPEDTMNATQRVEATINFEIPDRIPTYIMGIPPYSQCYKDFIAREEKIFDEGGWGDDEKNIILSPMGDFTMKYYFGADIKMTGIGIHNNFTSIPIKKDGTLDEEAKGKKILKQKEEIHYVDYFGKINGEKLLKSGETYSWYLEGFLKKKEDALAWYDRWGWVADNPVSEANVNAYNQFQSEFGDRVYLVPQISGVQLYESLWVIMGQAKFAYYCRKDPSYILKLVNDRKEAQLKILDELKKYKPKIIFGGDDMGQKGRPMLSPALYKKFFKDAYAEIFQKTHEELGAKIFNHSCGNIEELLPEMIDAGLDGWQSLEPASLIDHAAVRKKYPNFILCGGIDSREISFGTRDSIRKHAKEQIQKMGKEGGYICGPTHDFLTETPLDNCLHLRDAIQEFGKYPIN